MRRSLSFAVVLLLSTRLLAAGAVVVTNVNDSGPGSLRQAILDLPSCSRPCLLAFDIAGTPPAGSRVTAMAMGAGIDTGVLKTAVTRPPVSGSSSHPSLIGGV